MDDIRMLVTLLMSLLLSGDLSGLFGTGLLGF